MSLLFDEKAFIDSIIYNNDSNFEAALHEKYSSEIGFDSDKEKLIYSTYEKTFIIDIGLFNDYNMIQIPNINNTIFIDFIPKLIDILRCKINIEIENGYISCAETELNYNSD